MTILSDFLISAKEFTVDRELLEEAYEEQHREKLKAMLSMVFSGKEREQRLMLSGKEREDGDHLHMVGVRDRDKVLLLKDPAVKDMKLRAMLAAHTAQSSYRPFMKV